MYHNVMVEIVLIKLFLMSLYAHIHINAEQHHFFVIYKQMIYLPLFWSLNNVTYAAKCILLVELIFTFSIMSNNAGSDHNCNENQCCMFVQTNELLLGQKLH